MIANWTAALEPWWPMLAAAGVGLALGWLLRSRRGSQPPDAAPEVHFQTAQDGGANGGQAKPGEPTPFPARPPAAAAVGDVIVDAVPGIAPRADVTQAFAQFESKLHEWQTYASGEAVQTIDQPSIDDWDDLMDIEGIDLDLARFLYAEGVHTFDQIAAMSPTQLREVLERAGPAYIGVDPAAWPESAQRAVLAR